MRQVTDQESFSTSYASSTQASGENSTKTSISANATGTLIQAANTIGSAKQGWRHTSL